LQIVHDGADALEVLLSVTLYRAGELPLHRAECALQIVPRSSQALRVDALFQRFVDVGYVYRFGPVSHDLIVAELKAQDGALLARACTLPVSARVQPEEPELSGRLESRAGQLGLLVATRRFARRVEIELDAADVLPDDDFFHLPPGSEQWVALRTLRGEPLAPARAKSLRVSLRALNQRAPSAPITLGASS
jgi:beta-mannosidase